MVERKRAGSGQKAWQIGRLVVAETLQRLPVCAYFWSRFDARSSAGFTLFGEGTDHSAPCIRASMLSREDDLRAALIFEIAHLSSASQV